MKSLKVNPIVLIIINIIAPSMYIFLSGSYLQIIVFVLSAVGVLIGYLILRKHFEKKDISVMA